MISPLAYVNPKAKIGKDVTIHPFAYIDENVEIGDNCTIMPYASILSGTHMGNNNMVYQAAIIGATPQDFQFKGDETFVEIGNDNVIREKAIINRATFKGNSTTVGNGNFILEGVHVAHDTQIGNFCILGNGTKTAGNCTLDDKAILGSGVILKHGCHVGGWTLVRDGCRANKDVPPYIVAAHNPISYYGINAVLLSKKGNISNDILDNIAKAYRQIYQCGTSLENALRNIREMVPMSPEIQYILDFIEHSDKGIIGGVQ
ncbi:MULTISPECIES: acyl-ACP--UDP-N-acetylglucosamine O-acyltransferase [Bacteroidales]|jgi:acyl-[acyl-carrier-protein]-UDP-N-acetylglucosamine O-acyltransferase|uniref:acyl-ACP--UDP-N-acetylglucosamine O-acyltransferase n=1 Tax=Bacteroidales TaxID=171549 RepID=UPI0005751322|nr:MULTISPECIES: acyl-ACP--UDP-N-acetylglucosamine O-acyltransferase [Bacteroidales]KHM48539.1 UDP-N-acetylglucosamine acyltransferase [Coprobacter secundus]